jgi:hypothetical protein
MSTGSPWPQHALMLTVNQPNYLSCPRINEHVTHHKHTRDQIDSYSGVLRWSTWWRCNDLLFKWTVQWAGDHQIAEHFLSFLIRTYILLLLLRPWWLSAGWYVIVGCERSRSPHHVTDLRPIISASCQLQRRSAKISTCSIIDVTNGGSNM